jgi:4-hydroxy-tetrahydrodipicolinate synthase
MISGSIVAIVTPMRADGSVDDDALRSLLEWHIEAGTDAIVSVGTTGESATLNHDEHRDVIDKTVAHVDGRIPVIAGTGANSTSEAIELTEFAVEAGADAALLVTPYYNKPTQEGLFQHYRLLAETVDIPQILYNVPGRTAVDMSVDTVIRLSELPNIVGLKEAAVDGPERVAPLRESCGEGFALYSGNDDTARQFVLNGGNGVISVTANVAPAEMHRMIAAALEGDAETAAAIDDRLSLLHRDLFIESSPIPVKWALAEMKRIDTGIRLPLTWLDDQYHSAVREALAHAGIQ